MRRSVLFFPFVLGISCGPTPDTVPAAGDEPMPAEPVLAPGIRPPVAGAFDRIVPVDDAVGSSWRSAQRFVREEPNSIQAPTPRLKTELGPVRDAGP
jgi:hypothetical protein